MTCGGQILTFFVPAPSSASTVDVRLRAAKTLPLEIRLRRYS